MIKSHQRIDFSYPRSINAKGPRKRFSKKTLLFVVVMVGTAPWYKRHLLLNARCIYAMQSYLVIYTFPLVAQKPKAKESKAQHLFVRFHNACIDVTSCKSIHPPPYFPFVIFPPLLSPFFSFLLLLIFSFSLFLSHVHHYSRRPRPSATGARSPSRRGRRGRAHPLECYGGR